LLWRKNDNKLYTITEYCPNGDFFSLFQDEELNFSEKHARTYFRQLVSAIEFIHSHNYAHLDIKMENMFIDKNFCLRVGDFDMCSNTDEEEHDRGTKNYRAPEVIDSGFYERFPADIYSMGVCLFILLTKTHMPYNEDFGVFKLCLKENKDEFWKEHQKLKKKNIWSEDFKLLYEGMTKKNPKERLTLDQVKESLWFRGEVFTDAELSNEMKKVFRSENVELF
jgi:serine/threonine protein kinase